MGHHENAHVRKAELHCETRLFVQIRNAFPVRLCNMKDCMQQSGGERRKKLPRSDRIWSAAGLRDWHRTLAPAMRAIHP